MRLHWPYFLLLLSIVFPASGQDERYYRQILTGELPAFNESFSETIVTQFNVEGPSYRVDLDGDKLEEIIIPEKRDGVDWIVIRSSGHSKLYEAKLPATGGNSEIYKLRLVAISPEVKALIIFLDEGFTEAKRFEATARFFVLTYEKNDLTRISFSEGPHFFHEKRSQREQYWRRDYIVNVVDVNGDGVKEIAVNYHHIQRFMIYKGRGLWERF